MRQVSGWGRGVIGAMLLVAVTAAAATAQKIPHGPVVGGGLGMVRVGPRHSEFLNFSYAKLGNGLGLDFGTRFFVNGGPGPLLFDIGGAFNIALPRASVLPRVGMILVVHPSYIRQVNLGFSAGVGGMLFFAKGVGFRLDVLAQSVLVENDFRTGLLLSLSVALLPRPGDRANRQSANGLYHNGLAMPRT